MWSLGSDTINALIIRDVRGQRELASSLVLHSSPPKQMATWRQSDCLQARKSILTRNHTLPDWWFWTFQPFKLWARRCLLFKLPGLWYFIRGAWAGEVRETAARKLEGLCQSCSEIGFYSGGCEATWKCGQKQNEMDRGCSGKCCQRNGQEWVGHCSSGEQWNWEKLLVSRSGFVVIETELVTGWVVEEEESGTLSF